jgi:hypothetical protein
LLIESQESEEIHNPERLCIVYQFLRVATIYYGPTLARFVDDADAEEELFGGPLGGPGARRLDPECASRFLVVALFAA